MIQNLLVEAVVYRYSAIKVELESYNFIKKETLRQISSCKFDEIFNLLKIRYYKKNHLSLVSARKIITSNRLFLTK